MHVHTHTQSHSGRTYIIDLAFKEQFIIAKPTDKYAVLLDCLPAVHVAEVSEIGVRMCLFACSVKAFSCVCVCVCVCEGVCVRVCARMCVCDEPVGRPVGGERDCVC